MSNLIYNYERTLNAILRRIEKLPISKRNKDVILRFKDDCFSTGLSTGRVAKYMYYLIKLDGWLGKDFEDADKEDIKRLVGEIERSKYVEHSKMEFRICIRKLYKWLRDSEDFPPEVKWIKPSSRKIEKIKLPEELLTEDEIIRLIDAGRNPRDKAFVAILYETGCRIGEILPLKLKAIQFDQYGATLIVPNMAKKGSRRVRIISSVPYLTEWLDKHQDKRNPDAYLWLSKKGTFLSYGSLCTTLKKMGTRAGINKKVNPHNFRHSRSSFLASHLTEAQMNEYLGWVQGSDMARIYVHLSGREVDNAILKLHGIANNNEKEETKLKPKICPRCEELNPATNKFCKRCGMPLDKEDMIKVIEKDLERSKADHVLDRMMQDEEFRYFFIRKFKELSL